MFATPGVFLAILIFILQRSRVCMCLKLCCGGGCAFGLCDSQTHHLLSRHRQQPVHQLLDLCNAFTSYGVLVVRELHVVFQHGQNGVLFDARFVRAAHCSRASRTGGGQQKKKKKKKDF